MALAALSSGAKDPTEFINDPGYFVLGNHKFRDSSQGGHGQVDMKKSIIVSSDTYYYKLAIGMGVDLIHEYISPFGFGKKTGVDLTGEARGILPSSSDTCSGERNSSSELLSTMFSCEKGCS